MTQPGGQGPTGGSAEEAAAYWLARFEADDSDTGDRRRFDAWREADPAHAETYDRFRGQWDRLATAASAPGIVDLRLEALSLFPARRRFDWRQLGSLAAVFLMLVAGVTTLLMLPNDSGKVDQGPTKIADAVAPGGDKMHFANSYSTGVGERLTFRLADGSTVDLNTNSLVEIDYSRDVRRLNLLRGEALFHVAKNPSRPFVVQAAREQVTALGTVFMVRRDDNRTLVVLLEGKVKVDKLPANKQGGTIALAQLSPGQQLASFDGNKATVSRADLASVASWREGRLSFNDDPLSEVVAEVNRYSVRKLVIGDPEAGDLRVSGTFRTGSADRFARLLTQSFPVDVVPDKASNDLIVKGRP